MRIATSFVFFEPVKLDGVSNNLPDTYKGYINGDFDYTYPDRNKSI
jgi:hypothetical protein